MSINPVSPPAVVVPPIPPPEPLIFPRIEIFPVAVNLATPVTVAVTPALIVMFL
jgi:hypothetical protein